MQSYKKNNNLKRYIPENLDLDMILNEHPPDFDYKKDHLIHILHLITEIPANNKDLIDNRGFVPINAQTLQKHIHDYKPYLNYLIKAGIFESNGHFVIGKKSKVFRFTEVYRTINKEVLVDKSNFRTTTIFRKSKKNQSKLTYAYITKFLTDDNLHIDYEAAKKYLKSELQRNTAQNDEAAQPKYNAEILKIDRLRDGEIYSHIDDTAGRLHTNLTNLKREVRNFITYDGESLVSIDIRNSQPLLSSLLLSTNFYKSNVTSNFPFNIYKFSLNLNINNIPIKTLSTLTIPPSSTIMLVQQKEFIERQGESDLLIYRQKTSDGIFYEYMEKEIKKTTNWVFKTRGELKEMMFLVFYSRNSYFNCPNAEPKRIFAKLFPTVYKVFYLIKKLNHSDLPILLQTIEARLVLDNVARRISKERPALVIFTIHDSIVTTVGNEDYIAQIMREETQKCIGITPTLKYEYWRPENLIEKPIFMNQDRIFTPNVMETLSTINIA